MNLRGRIILKFCSIFILGGLLFYYFFSLDSSQNQIYYSCPSKTFLGINCPGCGVQRMMHHLLHLEFKEAFRYNPFFFILLPIILYIIFIGLWNFIFEQKKKPLKILGSSQFLIIILILLIIFGILRNIPVYPFDLLAPPD